ncbi:MAG TPA: exosortase/archaeosortase family protein [Bryobacteraceae bacterium]|jgi:exosortase|nr:exosortase/archaeosortase family protein [Bryobacteraceae bacterium]
MAASTSLPEHPPSAASRGIPWAAIGWFTALVVIVYFPIWKGLVNQWATDEDVGHGFLVPLVAGYIAWQRRAELLSLDWKPAWWGLAIMLWGVLQSVVGILGVELFLQRTSILITLVGMLLVLGGTAAVRVLSFPLLLLPFMIPIPAVIYNQVTFPLQLFASSVAEMALGWLNIPVLRDGNVLHLASQTLSVAEACSGIRSLLSLSFLALVYAYFFDKKLWMRWALLIGVIPIAILANAARVTITGILSDEVSPELAHGFYHTLEGWIVFLMAFAMLLVLHNVINRIYKIGVQRAAR